MSKNILSYNNVLTIDVNTFMNIPIIVRDKDNNIMYMNHINKFKVSNYKIRQDVINSIKQLQSDYCVDTIILESNKLFLDKMDKYPDPLIFRNVLLAFGLQVSIEDSFYNSIPNIIAIPESEWKPKILHKNTKYAIDLYKSHILTQSIYSDFIETIDTYNYYRALCLSECSSFDIFMNKKYQINKGD